MTVATLTIQVFTFGYFGQAIGLASLCIEATLGFPQAYSNWRTRSVEGLSVQMILMWFLGDFCKAVYFIVEVSIASLRRSPSSSSSAEPSSSPSTLSSSHRSSSMATTPPTSTIQSRMPTNPQSDPLTTSQCQRLLFIYHFRQQHSPQPLKTA
jgi:uncharacterized protein with PQ loop repeat